jgi:hypothetical protein
VSFNFSAPETKRMVLIIKVWNVDRTQKKMLHIDEESDTIEDVLKKGICLQIK